MTAPLLVFGWGNPSRGDDALGPLFVERLRAGLRPDDGVDVLEDYQLQVEHALDLVGRQRVLFVDASLDCRAPFEVMSLRPAQDVGITTHAMSPQALLQVFCDVQGNQPPPCTLLAIRGDRFELGEELSPTGRAHLAAALAWVPNWLGAMAAPLPCGLGRRQNQAAASTLSLDPG